MLKSFRTSHLPPVVLLSLLFGTNLVLSRFLLSQIHPLVYLATRMPIATLLAFLWTRVRHGRFPRGRQIWIHGSVVGIFATAAPMTFFILSLQYQSSGVTALFISLTPVSAMIYGHFLLADERLNATRIIGSVVSFAGVGLLLITGETGLAESRWEGFVLVLVGVACNGFGIVHLRRRLSQAATLDITSVRLLVATVVIVPVAALLSDFDYSAVEWSGVLVMIYGTLTGTLLGFVLYSGIAARFGAAKATQTEYLVPVVTVLTGILLLGERLTLVITIGAVVVIAGVIVATRKPRSVSQSTMAS